MIDNKIALARQIRHSYQRAIKEGNIPLAVSLKQEFYNDGYHTLINLDQQEVDNDDK